MSSRRLKSRVASARALGNGRLDGYVLTFNKISDKDGSGKCGIVKSPGNHVFGMLFDVDEAEKKLLDRIEGLGYGYNQKTVKINRDSGGVLRAYTYIPTAIDALLRPFSWYKRHVLEGAKEANLPPWYVDRIHAIEADKDPDTARERSELRIYS